MIGFVLAKSKQSQGIRAFLSIFDRAESAYLPPLEGSQAFQLMLFVKIMAVRQKASHPF
jgi:hypothetical protein